MTTLLLLATDEVVPSPVGRCRATRLGATRQVLVTGELCLESVGALEQAAVLAGIDTAELLVVDVTAVTFADVPAVGALLGLRRRAEVHDVRLVVVVAPGPVARLLALTGAEERLDIVVDRGPAQRRAG